MSEKYLKLIYFLSDIDNNIKVYTYEQYGTDFIFYEVLYKDIQKFKNTPKYKRLLSYVNDNNYNYSVKEMNILLAHAVTIDDTIYRSRENLILYYETYPELFYIFETAKELYAVKYLLFIDNRYENLVENILFEREIQFKKNSLHCSKQDLIVYIFVEKYDNYYQMEKLLRSQETLSQTIYKTLSEQNGVPSSLIGLYLNEHYGNIHILGKTDIFSENRRVSNSGIRDDLGNLFRSSWEANIARLFNLKGISWTFEKLPPADGYLPDFFCNNKTTLK